MAARVGVTVPRTETPASSYPAWRPTMDRRRAEIAPTRLLRACGRGDFRKHPLRSAERVQPVRRARIARAASRRALSGAGPQKWSSPAFRILMSWATDPPDVIARKRMWSLLPS